MKITLRFSPYVIALVTLFIGKGICQNDVFLKIQAEETHKINVAVAAISTDQNPGLAANLRQILIDDLNNSGFLTVVPAASDSDLSRSDAEVQITGTITHKSSRFSFEFNLTEVATGRKLMTKSFRAYPFAIRVLAHTVSDEIVYRLCGDYGIASTKIAFMIERKNGKDLAMMDYDGQRLSVLTTTNSINLLPDWSVDGQSILFATYALGNGPQLAVYSLKSNHFERFLNYPGTYTSPEYSPDGKRVAFALTKNGNVDIYTADRNGDNLLRLTNHPAIDTAPSWSPDGREIAFSSDRGGNPQIYIMDAEGGNVRRLTYEYKYNASPKWSPKGDLIAFVTLQSAGFQIYLIDVTGENLTCLTDNKASYESPSWSPNGSHLAFASNRSGQWDIYTMLRDGSLMRRLTFTGGNTGPSWSPRLKPFN